MAKDKVLVVDDNKINRAMLNQILQANYSVVEADNGKTALDILYSDNDVAAVLLDIKMPVMNGYEFLKVVRAVPAFANLPVFAVTDGEDESSESEAFKCGETAYFDKIYKPSIILDRLREAISALKLLRDAQTDSLTGLMDRDSVRGLIAAYVKHMEGTSEKAALVILSVENMSAVTEHYAKNADVLTLLSQIVQKECKPDTILGRLSVFEFIFLFKQLQKPSLVEDTVKKCIAHFKGTSASGGGFVPSIAVGVCPFSGDDTDIGALYKHADKALKQARDKGENEYVIYQGEDGPAGSKAEKEALRVLDEIGSYVFVCDAKTDEILFQNSRVRALIDESDESRPCVCKMLGLSRDDCAFCGRVSFKSEEFAKGRVRSEDGRHSYFYRFKIINWYGNLAKLAIITEEKLISTEELI